MTDQTVATSGPERHQPTAADIKPGAWLAETEFRGVAQALDVYPYHDGVSAWVFLTYLEVGQAGPNCEHLRADELVELATPEGVDQVREEQRRRRVRTQLHQLGDLIQAHQLTLPSEFIGVTVTLRYSDPAIVERIGEVLGVPVKTVGRETSLEWPGGEPGASDVVATFYAYAPETYEARAVDEEQTGEPVPDDVEGYANEQRAGEIRQVSAPPAAGPQ